MIRSAQHLQQRVIRNPAAQIVSINREPSALDVWYFISRAFVINPCLLDYETLLASVKLPATVHDLARHRLDHHRLEKQPVSDILNRGRGQETHSKVRLGELALQTELEAADKSGDDSADLQVRKLQNREVNTRTERLKRGGRRCTCSPMHRCLPAPNGR